MSQGVAQDKSLEGRFISTQNGNGNGDNSLPEAKLWIPKNENIIPLLEGILGADALRQLKESQHGEKELRWSLPYRNGEVEIQTARAEGIASEIINLANPAYVGISGSDFVLVNVLSGRYGHFYMIRKEGEPPISEAWKVDRSGRKYLDLGEIIEAEKGLTEGSILLFHSDDKNISVRMRVLPSYETPPFLCLLGPNDNPHVDPEQQYKDMVNRKIAEEKPLRVVFEERYNPLATNLIITESVHRGFDFTLKEVPGSTEGYVRKGGEADRDDLCDIAVEVGRTFQTAGDNGLAVYRTIMQTYPVEVVCYRNGDAASCTSLEEITGVLKLAQSPGL